MNVRLVSPTLPVTLQQPGVGKITRPEEVMRFIRNGDGVNHANAQVSLHEVETLLAANAYATISHAVCPNQSQGPSVAMKLDVPR